jgi:hypothetical protein
MIKRMRFLASNRSHERIVHPHLLRVGSWKVITEGTDELWGEFSVGVMMCQTPGKKHGKFPI